MGRTGAGGWPALGVHTRWWGTLATEALRGGQAPAPPGSLLRGCGLMPLVQAAGPSGRGCGPIFPWPGDCPSSDCSCTLSAQDT